MRQTVCRNSKPDTLHSVTPELYNSGQENTFHLYPRVNVTECAPAKLSMCCSLKFGKHIQSYAYMQRVLNCLAIAVK